MKYWIYRHRPFSCFYWHFQNQRRRRPFRRKDGTFSYDPDFYCNDYDEQSGVCPNGDEYVLNKRFSLFSIVFENLYFKLSIFTSKCK